MEASEPRKDAPPAEAQALERLAELLRRLRDNAEARRVAQENGERKNEAPHER